MVETCSFMLSNNSSLLWDKKKIGYILVIVTSQDGYDATDLRTLEFYYRLCKVKVKGR